MPDASTSGCRAGFRLARLLFCDGTDRLPVVAAAVAPVDIAGIEVDAVRAARFVLSLCYADGKTHTSIYDKLEYCSWRENDTKETVRWDLDYLIQEIINDIESTVPSKLQAE